MVDNPLRNGGSKKKPATVDELPEVVGNPRREALEKMRAIVKRALPGVVESIKWGQPVYEYRGSNVICFMIYDDHVNFGLFMGAKLKPKRLEGTGKGLRHVKVTRPDDVDEREFTRLAKGAAKLV